MVFTAKVQRNQQLASANHNLFSNFATKYSEMKNFWPFFFLFLGLIACSAEDDDEADERPIIPGAPASPRGPFNRTVLVYISGENGLSYYIDEELQEIRKGSAGIGQNALVVYVDDSNAQRNPYILWIKEGKTMDSLTLENDPLSSSVETMSYVLNYASTYYPAEEYGLVLWGHASGWLFEDSLVEQQSAFAPRKAYGIDNGMNNNSDKGKWMNMSTLAKTLWEWKHLKFIFADCCQFQCIESAYELRNVTDYIIGSPAEIPGVGAPYDTVVKGFFDSSDSFYETIVDNYFRQTIPTGLYSSDGWNVSYYDSKTPLSVIKTSELRNLAEATNSVLHTFLPYEGEKAPELMDEKLIYYYGNSNNKKYSLMYDMNDVIRHYTLDNQAAYDTWKDAFDKCVVYRKNADKGWMTKYQIQAYVFFDGILTDERYGGVSMFVPQERKGTNYYPYTNKGVNYDGYNADIKKTSWYSAARLQEFGW